MKVWKQKLKIKNSFYYQENCSCIILDEQICKVWWIFLHVKAIYQKKSVREIFKKWWGFIIVYNVDLERFGQPLFVSNMNKMLKLKCSFQPTAIREVWYTCKNPIPQWIFAHTSEVHRNHTFHKTVKYSYIQSTLLGFFIIQMRVYHVCRMQLKSREFQYQCIYAYITHSNINILYFSISHQQPRTEPIITCTETDQRNGSAGGKYYSSCLTVMSTWICVSFLLPLE